MNRFIACVIFNAFISIIFIGRKLTTTNGGNYLIKIHPASIIIMQHHRRLFGTDHKTVTSFHLQSCRFVSETSKFCWNMFNFSSLFDYSFVKNNYSLLFNQVNFYLKTDLKTKYRTCIRRSTYTRRTKEKGICSHTNSRSHFTKHKIFSRYLFCE